MTRRVFDFLNSILFVFCKVRRKGGLSCTERMGKTPNEIKRVGKTPNEIKFKNIK